MVDTKILEYLRTLALSGVFNDLGENEVGEGAVWRPEEVF